MSQRRHHLSLTLAPSIIACMIFATAAPVVVVAQAQDPAVTTINGLNTALTAAMRQGGSASARAKTLEPAVEAAFDFPAMMKFAVGPSKWAAFSTGDQAALSRAFARYSAATYAHNFDAYAGERFTVDPAVQVRLPDKLVKSQLVSKSGPPTAFTYRMRQSTTGAWKVIDVFFNGSVSQLASQRSDFQSSLDAGGAKALIQKLDAKTADLLKS